jgi:hypothetical protein
MMPPRRAGFRAPSEATRNVASMPTVLLPLRRSLALLVCGCAAGTAQADDRAVAAPTPAARGLELRVVELPPVQPPGFGPPRRAHHALSFRNEAPKRWLQSIGVDAADCTTRVRFPSHFGPTPDGRGLAAEVSAQVHFSCRF